MPRDFENAGGGGLGLDNEQRRNAAIIIQVGLKMGMSWRDIKIGLMAALQESGLRNLHYGDRDSLGLFQQRPSAGWGTPDQVTDPEYASRKFFQALKSVHNRDDMPLWMAAAEVQRPAEEYRTYYRKHFGTASNILKWYRKGHPGVRSSAGGGPQAVPTDGAPNELLSLQKFLAESKKREAPTTPGIAAAKPPGMDASIEPLVLPNFNSQAEFNRAVEALGLTPRGRKGANQTRKAIIKFAKQFIGTPYVWGGTSPDGFDCSGLIYYVLQHFGYKVPRVSYQLGQPGYNLFAGRTNLKNLRPGDLVLWDNSSRNNGADHVAFYLGNGLILEAPRPGRSVTISELYDRDNAWGVRLKL